MNSCRGSIAAACPRQRLKGREAARPSRAGPTTSGGTILSTARPTLLIVDGSVAVTGALVAAARQAELLAGEADTVLALPRGHQVPPARLCAFAEVIELPIVPLRKSAGSLLVYGPVLIASSLKLRRAMRRRECERLQFNDFYFLQGAILRLLGFRGRIVTFVRIDPTRFGIAGRVWLAAARRSSTELVAVSHFIQRQLGPRFPGRLIYQHVQPRPAGGRHPTSRTLLFVGNFIEGKGQDAAIAAFNQIAPAFPEARLRLVGGDMGLDKNRQFREQLLVLADRGPARNRIEFHDGTDDLGPHYAESLAALNFSASESFSMTCLEASAAGLPVVATRCGGPEEIIEHGETGFLVPLGNVTAMAERMAWLLDHPDKAAAMGNSGRRLVGERFSPERSKAALKALFDL